MYQQVRFDDVGLDVGVTRLISSSATSGDDAPTVRRGPGRFDAPGIQPLSRDRRGRP